MNTHDIDIELPAEFRSGNDIPVTQATIKRERMEEILRAAIDPYAKRIAALESQLEAIGAGGVTQGQRLIEADRKRRGEPDAVAACHAVRPYIDSIVCYASTMDEHDGNRVAKMVEDVCAAHPQPAEPDTATIADYEEALADHRRLVRELDVLLNGEEGAAKQASLCDIVAQVRREGIKTAEPRLDAPAQVGHTRFGEGVPWSTVIGAAQRYYAAQNTKEQERLQRAAENIKALHQAEPGSTHHVHRGTESLPCYCNGTYDHPIGKETLEQVKEIELRVEDLHISTYSPTPSPQWAAHNDRGVRIVHLPTGTVAESHEELSPHRNREIALDRLRQAIAAAPVNSQREAQNYADDAYNAGWNDAKAQIAKPVTVPNDAETELLDYAMAIAHERELCVLGHKHDSDAAVDRFRSAVRRMLPNTCGLPSPVEIKALAEEHLSVEDVPGYGPTVSGEGEFSRALLARYGNAAQPTAGDEPVKVPSGLIERLMECADDPEHSHTDYAETMWWAAKFLARYGNKKGESNG